MEKSDAKFKMENARITRIKNLENVAFVTVLVKTGRFPDYFDLTVFEHGLGQWQMGDAVNIVGELRKRKPRDGSSIWEVQMVAQQFTEGDGNKAPRPRQSSGGPAPSKAPPAIDPTDDVDF